MITVVKVYNCFKLLQKWFTSEQMVIHPQSVVLLQKGSHLCTTIVYLWINGNAKHTIYIFIHQWTIMATLLIHCDRNGSSVV